MTQNYKARKTVEKHIGRSLYNPINLFQLFPEYKFPHQVFEVVHHINRDRSDNRPENLYVFRDMSSHTKYHTKVKNWAYGLMGLSHSEKVEYLKSFPELKSNLNQLKKWNEEEITIAVYFDD